jgi:hypothetical protein
LKMMPFKVNNDAWYYIDTKNYLFMVRNIKRNNNVIRLANSKFINLLTIYSGARFSQSWSYHRSMNTFSVLKVHTEKMQDMAQKDLLSLICDTYKVQY